MKRTVMSVVLALAVMSAIVLAGCTRQEQKTSTKLQVVTTLFPLYDFARIIAGERAEVTMLLPPGMEPHSFEPKPNDIIRVSRAGLFIYTNRYMEPWAETILKGLDRQRLRVVDAGQGVRYTQASAADEHDDAGHGSHGADSHAGVVDPHIWLDFGNAALMVDSILAGFVAATYMRGVPFIQLPTTLLAQVDSSVGGKVAVNHPRGKNIIGAFYQPKLVMADMNVLSTLEVRELKSGLAEVIKYGVIADGAFFAWLERNLEQLLVMEMEALARAVATSCKIKAAVVQEDETEKGYRAILNFGHTLGHAIEALTGYNTYRHGEAVAIGMVAESRLASVMGLLPAAEAQRIEDLIKKAGLPVQIPVHLSVDELLASMERDKKVLDGQYTFALPVQIGRAEVFRGIPGELLRQILTRK
jgi:3-dehydroquinate synthase